MFSFSGDSFSHERGKLENSTRRGKSQVQQLNFPQIFIVVCVTAAGARIDLFSLSSVKISSGKLGKALKMFSRFSGSL
jgi:hypothetical protein